MRMVYMDITIDGWKAGRLVFELFYDDCASLG